MIEGQQPRMKLQRVLLMLLKRIEPVAQNRMPYRFEVSADLVRPPRFQSHRKQSARIDPLQPNNVRHRRLSIRIDRHQKAIPLISSERRGNRHALLFQIARNDGRISALGVFGGELFRQ